MKISKIIGREIFDSRGFPTIECELILDNGVSVFSSVPSGTSRGTYEAFELRDGGRRLMGKGVLKAIENLEKVIAPELIGKEPDVVQMDLKMIEMDGTDNKANLGANALLAASIAVLKAQALSLEIELFRLIVDLCDLESVTLPLPMFNVINGGVHADNNLSIQEILLIPSGFKNFRNAMEASIVVFHELKALLHQDGKKTLVGDEGGFASDFVDEQEALGLLMEAINLAGFVKEKKFVLGLDIAASQFYDEKTKLYDYNGKAMIAQDLIELYMQWSDQYPIYSLEDGLSDSDWDGWALMTERLGNKLQIIGDDIFVTNPKMIVQGMQNKVANAVLIKPNQIGTITETLQVAKLCKDFDMDMIFSHRSGETEDTIIVDLAVGTSAKQIKAGGCSRGERLAKYNQLLRIEEKLLFHY